MYAYRHLPQHGSALPSHRIFVAATIYFLTDRNRYYLFDRQIMLPLVNQSSFFGVVLRIKILDNQMTDYLQIDITLSNVRPMTLFG